VVVRTPSPFPYESDKAVPWRYDVLVFNGGHDVSIMRVGSSMLTAKVTNIYVMSGTTRSGCVFTPPELLVGLKGKGKAKENEIEREKMGHVMNNNVTLIAKPTEIEENSGKKEISVEEATKFLKII